MWPPPASEMWVADCCFTDLRQPGLQARRAEQPHHGRQAGVRRAKAQAERHLSAGLKPTQPLTGRQPATSSAGSKQLPLQRWVPAHRSRPAATVSQAAAARRT